MSEPTNFESEVRQIIDHHADWLNARVGLSDFEAVAAITEAHEAEVKRAAKFNFCPNCMAFNSTALEYDLGPDDLPKCSHGKACREWYDRGLGDVEAEVKKAKIDELEKQLKHRVDLLGWYNEPLTPRQKLQKKHMQEAYELRNAGMQKRISKLKAGDENT